jgi:glycosyltransferase involved in cell wall biosynthesis
MKHLLYIGNQLSKSSKTITTIDTLSELLRLENYHVRTASKKSNKIFRLLDMLFCVCKYRNQVDYVLIDTYSTSNFYYAYLCSQLCRLLKLNYVPILHGGNLPNRLKNSPGLSKAIFKSAYINVAPSLFIKTKFQDFGYKNLVYIPNTILLENYPFKKRTFDAVNLFWVRSFSEIYNPNLAIEVLSILKKQNIDANLCMVGPEKDGALYKAKEYARELNVEVIFTGKLSKQEWIKHSQDFNIFINTTNFDNMPVSVIEAMALGLPVVSTNVGGLPFLIDNEKDGVLVNPNNADLFVNAIKKLIANPIEAENLALNARTKVEQFNWDDVKNQWFSLLK